MSADAFTTIYPAKSRPFAAACLAAWSKASGVDHGWKIGWTSISVPSAIVGEARAELERKAAERAGQR